MSSLATGYEHRSTSEDGVPVIEGTGTKVIELVLETQAYGWSPEDLHLQHPYLSLGQIYSALAYYWDHKEALDSDIERRLENADDVRRRLGQAPLVDKLRAKGLI
ncbi:MAG: DUF433 domain-containing protein [Blastocatellia bacterium]